MQNVVIADNFAVFRAGMARFLAVEDDFRIVGQCDDLTRLYKATEVHRKGTFLFAGSLEPDLQMLVPAVRSHGGHIVTVLERGDSPMASQNAGIEGILYRDVSREDLLRCLRAVGAGRTFHQQPTGSDSLKFETDVVGERARSRLSPKELQIIRLLIKGYKNKDIAEELNNSEQVIKNYLRSIFDKTGVSDRLELALFTIHHKLLLQAVENAPEPKRPPGTTPAAGPPDAAKH